ncbi:MAG: alpha/beta fold hydrolase, partial [Nitrospira sp.]|nr:alpha/beta fold hydrolase [Nitrospira sp.]
MMSSLKRVNGFLSLCFTLLFVWAGLAFAGGPSPAPQGVHVIEDHRIFNLGDFPLESGITLPDAKLSYVTHGTLNAEKSNAILVPSFYSGDHHIYDFLIGPGKALDPVKYFIIVTDMFASGHSSSPSNTPPPFNGPNFPEISIRDNVKATYRLVTEQFRISHLKAVAGGSMGAQQAFQWAVSYPDFIDAIMPWCGTAKEYPFGIVRLEGAKSAIMTDAAWSGGHYTTQPKKGLKALAHHWAAWGYSQEWWSQELFKQPPFNSPSIEVTLQGEEEYWLSKDANNLLSQAITWQKSNVGNTPGFNGDHEKALRSIKARVLYMPCQTDLYFPIEAAEYESQFISNMKLVPIPST